MKCDRATFIVLCLLGSGSQGLVASPDKLDFNRDVRPILSDKCYHCHGPDEHGRKAKLRLDRYEDAIANAKAIDPANLAKSEMLARIFSSDPDEVMPPPKAHRDMTESQKDILKRWVESGAKYEAHWAFVAPEKVEPPKGRNARWQEGAIDRFIFAGLQAAGLQPMSGEEKRVLLRRITFDLTGLPPTIAEQEAFVADTAPDAYEKVVDRLLASPHYGERMALAWMDASRYGDSSVMHADGPRTMWPWRDWVIRSYNENKPFDDFTIEQLAGDLIPDASYDQILATGFNRNHATSDEGGAFAEELRVEYIVDRVQTTANVWLGLSMECAQCHDHKFDPISMKEYYQFFAYFNNNKDPGMQTRRGNQSPVIDVQDDGRLKTLAEIAEQRKVLEAKIAARGTANANAIAEWVKDQEAALLLDTQSVPMPKGLVHHVSFDEGQGDVAADGVAGTKGRISGVWGKADREGNAGVRLNGKSTVDFPLTGTFAEYDRPFTMAAWVNPSGAFSGAIFSRMNVKQNYRGFDLWAQSGQVGTHIIHSWPGNAIKVVSKKKLKAKTWQHVAVTYDGGGKAGGVRVYIDGVYEPHNVEQDGVTATIKTDVPFKVGARTPGANINGSVDDVRLYDRVLSEDELRQIMGGGSFLGELLATPAEERSARQEAALTKLYLAEHDKPFRDLSGQLSQLDKKEAELKSTKTKITSMIMADNDKPRMTYILDRGAYDQPKKDEEIFPGTPAILPPPVADSPANRLGLARWIMQEDHPLSARVAVNRYWAMLFGKGLVSSVMDFGNQGQPPANQELLDWLAVDFRESGWDVKRMIKKMVMAQAYRQSARITPNVLEVDPENRLLSRGPRYRLQGEFIRDNALAVSGLLNPKVGGESVKPYQPPGIWNEVSLNGGLKYKQDEGDKLYRRSMYTYWKRSAPAPNMLIFDAPTREKCVVQRARTNTPLQALVTLNDVHFVEASRKFAERIISEGGDSFESRIQYAYKLALCRDVTPEELVVCQQVFDAQLKSFSEDEDAAKKYIGLGESSPAEGLDPVELAAYAIVANMLLNLDEVLTRG